jgi:hypothetical protein
MDPCSLEIFFGHIDDMRAAKYMDFEIQKAMGIRALPDRAFTRCVLNNSQRLSLSPEMYWVA